MLAVRLALLLPQDGRPIALLFVAPGSHDPLLSATAYKARDRLVLAAAEESA